MDKMLHYALCFYHGSCLVRDTMEYCIGGDRVCSVETFEAKKKGMENMLAEGSYLDAFCKQNGENGEKVFKNLKTLYNTVYSNEGTFIRVEDGKLVIDQSQADKVMTLTVGLKVTLSEISKLHLNYLMNQGNKIDPEFLVIVDKEMEFFGCVATMVLARNVFLDRFPAFNKVMKENNGEPSVESNFISSEITNFIQNAAFVREKCNIGSESVKKCVEAFAHCVDLLSGKVKLEVTKDKTLESNFYEYLDAMQVEINNLEPTLRDMHTYVVNEMIEFERLQAKLAAGDPAAN